MSTISASTTTTTAYTVTADTTGALVIQTGATPTTAVTVSSAQVVTLANALPVTSGGTGTTSTTFVNLTTNVTGTLPVANGGTGVTSSTGSGSVVLGTSPTISSPTINGTPVMGASVITRGIAVASTSGTSIDFTALPNWIKRITIMFQGVSLSSTANILVQLGTGSTTFTTTGYLSTSNGAQSGGNSVNTSTAGFVIIDTSAAAVVSGHMVITNITGNNWVSSHVAKRDTALVASGAGDVSLGAVLTAVRITSTSTDTFDAGSINILYE